MTSSDRSAEATLLVGGKVLTMDRDAPQADAVLVGDGRVTATGMADDLAAGRGRDARRIDVAGATIMPGLIDTHPHLLHFAAREYGLVDLTDAVNHDEIVARIRARAETMPKGQWILATPVGEPHYFIRRSYLDLEERRLPDRHVLDRAAPDHPVHIQAWAPKTPNVCAFNSAGLFAVGLDDTVPDRVGNVWLDKDDHGRLSGILRGAVNNYYCFDPFWVQILLKMPGPGTWDLHDSTIGAMADYNRQGVTTVYEAHNMRAEHVEAYVRLRDEGTLSVRVMAATEAETYAYPPLRPLSIDAFLDNLRRAAGLIRHDDDMLRVTGASFSPAAPLGPGTIRMHEPYRGPFGEWTRGLTVLTPEKQAAFIEFCAEENLRANFVVAGYRDTDDMLDGLEAVADRYGIADRRWLVQHALVITEQQARRLKRLGFDVTTSLSFVWGKGDVYGERAGRHVWRDQVPVKRLMNAGLTVGCGSDWGPKNAWEQIQLAETHEFCGSGHRNDTPDHKLTREESLRTWTRDAARVLGWDGLGHLAPGAHADLIVVDRDPLTCPLDDLPSTRTHLTMVGGRIVHDDGVAG